MTLRPHAVVNSTRGEYLQPPSRQTALPALANAPFSAVSGLIYLLGTSWQGERVSITAGVGEELSDSGEGSTERLRREALGRAQGETHEDRIPHMVVNFDRRERLDPSVLGDGSSLGQMACGCLSGGPGGVQSVLTMLLHQGHQVDVPHVDDFPTRSPLLGSWAGDRVAVLPVHSSRAPWSTDSITAQAADVLARAGLAAYHLDRGEVRRGAPPRRSKGWRLRHSLSMDRH